jgi:hypothetical protein
MDLRQLLPEPAITFLRKIKNVSPNPRKAAADLAERLLGKMGLAVFAYRPDYHYCPQLYGTNHHKLLDIRDQEVFGKLAREVIGHGKTLLSYDRLYYLYQAVCHVSRTNPGAHLAEVGVYKGGGTYFIAAAVDKLFGEKTLIHSFDTFTGHPPDIDSELDGRHTPGLFADTSFAEVRQYLSGFDNVHLYQGRFQDRCHEVSGRRFGFLHLDVDIFSATRDCLDFFRELLDPGGIIIVDDYGFTTCKGSKAAVDNFTKERTDFLKVHLETGQCLLVRIS